MTNPPQWAEGLVKPLEWEGRVKKEYPIRFITNSTCGKYQITEWLDGSGNVIHFTGKFGKPQRIEAAPMSAGGSRPLKAAAQAYHAARIVAALDLGKVQALVEAADALAKMADRYDPREGDDDLECWSAKATPKIKHLRAIRAALASLKGEKP